jgi:SPP1 family predicted phage head-tail adaptor
MPAGPYRHRVIIQSFTAVSDGMGGWEETWADLATVWARVEALKGEEYFAAAQMQNSVSHRVTMRYRADLTPSHRLIFEGRTLNIEAVLPDERKSRLVIMCTEQV